MTREIFLSYAISLTLAFDILLVCGEGVVPRLSRWLPLGGSHLAQLGLLLGLAVVAAEFWDRYSHLGR